MSAPSSIHPVLIVGAGFSGTMVALQLARRGVRAVVVDRAEAAGRGIAYGTRDPAHVLNVPAGKMSAWPDAPGGPSTRSVQDFAAAASVAPGSFAERRAYGDYLRAQLDAAVAAGAVELVEGEVVSARPGVPRLRSGRTGWRVSLMDGRNLEAEQLVLATGNGRPAHFSIPGWPDEATVQDPWGAEAGGRLAEAARTPRRGSGQEGLPLLLIGTGLTMVDVVMTLERLGYRGQVTAVSRRGQVPRAHATGSVPLPPPDLGEIPERLSDAVAWLRARGLGVDWRSAVDSMRPVSQTLWQGWPEAVKARFVRHARPWWDVHRHRIAPEAAAAIERWIGERRLTVLAGRVVEGGAGGVLVAQRRSTPRGTVPGTITVEAALAVNCTGPAERLEANASPLLGQMLADGLIAAGELGLGVRVDGEGGAGPGLWAVGPLTKGRWWEITAVPDIRVQAERVAGTIASGLGQGSEPIW